MTSNSTISDMEGTLTDFLAYVQGQKEAALIIASPTGAVSDAVQELTGAGYQRADSGLQALKLLNKGVSVAALLTHPISKEWYDFIVQYTDRGGMIQLMDKSTMEFQTAQFDARKAHLVVVVTSEDLQKIEAGGFMLRDKVGLVEQI